MNIRRKVFLLFALTSFGVLAFLLAGAKVILAERFSQLEKDQVVLNMDRVQAAAAGLLEAMLATAKDYGNWDDTYAYLAAPNDAYIQANFVEATFQNLKLSMVLLTGEHGAVVFSQGYDLVKKELEAVPDSWMELFRENGLLNVEAVQGDPAGRMGLLLTEDGPLMLVVKPVLTSEAKGPPRGAIIMGRLLGAEEIELLSRLTLLNISWLNLKHIPITDGPSGQSAEAWEAQTVVIPLTADAVEGLRLAKDMRGVPMGIWRIEMDRQLYSKGMAGMLYFLAVMAAGGIFFVVVFAFVLERTVLGRLWRLNAQVVDIASLSDPAGRVDTTGADEISELGDSINGMLKGLEDSAQELKAVARQLREASDAADSANRAKGLFLATMSHEIRTPINAIIGFTELAESNRPAGKLGEYLRGIAGASTHLRGLIDNILDFSKIEAGKIELEETPFSLADVATEVASLVKPLADSKRIGFGMFLDPALPPLVVGDCLRLRQVLVNLASNAVKFTGSGGVTVRILVDGAASEKASVLFEVEDTGIGISPEAREAVFSPFMQADSSTTRRFGGTGLGLAISRELVGLLGGSLDVESASGKGSRFFFTLAFKVAAGLPPSVAPRAGDVDLSGKVVLVAEDNVFNRQVFREIIRGAGGQAVLTEDGMQAVLAVLGQKFDVALMDMHMPELDGLEATRAIRAHPCGADLPIIALTAGAMDDDREACLEAGMNDYLTKPVSRKVLLETLGKWVGASAGAGCAPVGVRQEAVSRIAGADKTEPVDMAVPYGVDLKAALEIFGGDQALLARMLALFVQSFQGACATIASLIGQGDMEGAFLEAHSLKGAAGNIGAMDAQNVALRLEKALKAGDEHEAAVALAELERAMTSLFAWLHARGQTDLPTTDNAER